MSLGWALVSLINPNPVTRQQEQSKTGHEQQLGTRVTRPRLQD